MKLIFSLFRIVFIILGLFYWIDFQVMLKYQGENIELPFKVMIMNINLSLISMILELLLIDFFSFKYFSRFLYILILVRLLFASLITYYFVLGQLNLNLDTRVFILGGAVFSLVSLLLIKYNKK